MTLPPINYQKRGKDRRVRSAQHLAFVRKRLCIAWARQECEGKVEAAHVKDLAPLGRGSVKPDDTFTVSMCRRHHQESEKNEGAWGREMGLDVMALALEFAASSPDRAIREAAKAYAASLQKT
jgi:hypothetical protein